MEMGVNPVIARLVRSDVFGDLYWSPKSWISSAPLVCNVLKKWIIYWTPMRRSLLIPSYFRPVVILLEVHFRDARCSLTSTLLSLPNLDPHFSTDQLSSPHLLSVEDSIIINTKSTAADVV